ncbi:MAG: SUF system NifU family Fe-S cluster assembly protein [Candidatus Micrarchaeota archaeon]|nr:SUF system NifU family Fe-S cluster assembly protein [Candidatus Micrarchaeota archaeon]
MGLDIYAEQLIQHYEHPNNKRKMEDASVSMNEENVSCGDVITVYLKLNGDKIEDVSFDGNGCVISMGSASMLTEELKGKTLAQLEKMQYRDLLKVIGIDPGPVRMHCATLSLRALKKAAFAFERKPVDTSTKEL